LEFNADGTIKRVTPTLEGIRPLGTTTEIGNISFGKSGKALHIYPNPVSVSGTLNIKLPEIKDEPMSFSFYSAQGNLMYRKNKHKPVTDETIVLPTCMQTGIYLLQTQYGNAVYNNIVLVN
jgi:hypothetical protein